ncbi:amino acid adenylation domain-containing protein [Paenibacillus apiarius]|nr:amino acid adenylation domain-containing protein [Paenibacillus apiarius]
MLEGLAIHHCFEQQVNRCPDQIAVVCNDKHLTYRQLNERANQLASVLAAKKASANTIVAIMLERSLEMIVSILAVLKAGGCFLTIDIEYPTNRIHYMLSDSQAKTIITTKEIGRNIRFQGEHLLLDEANIWNLPKVNPCIKVQGTDLAYLIYTSGTTGQPKGVLLEHKGIANLKVFWEEAFGITPQDRMGLFASISFDASVWEMFMALLNGAALYVLSKELLSNLRDFQDYLAAHSITVMTLPPSYAIHLDPATLPDLRLLITAGSSPPRDFVNNWNKTVAYVNAYGPTEASICATAWMAPPQWCSGNHISIGKPIRNTQVYILDENKQPAASGELGELCIGGIGLARGYLNRPELTAEKFIDNPFVPGEKMYCTGDYAKWLPDGNVEYHGRMDQQVKIRGHRIELGEIEAVLQKFNPITEAAVIVQKDRHGDPSLSAYYVANKEISISSLRFYLEKDLPRYMVPNQFYCIEKMPLTINGKVDHEQLLLPEYNQTAAPEYTAPRNQLEMMLVEIWQEVLGIDAIGIHDNFYLLGGDSIKAIQMAAKLYERKLKMDIQVLMMNPTISAVAPVVEPIAKECCQGIVQGEVLLSPIQHWFFEQRFSSMHHWNQSILLYNPEGYNKDIIQMILAKLIEHHDALRMVYKFDYALPMQINRGMEEGVLGFTVFEVPRQVEAGTYIHQEAGRLQSRIRLSQGPLVQAGLFQTTEGDHLFLAIHHLVADGVSFRILLEDLSRAYDQAIRGEAVVLPNKTDSYQTWTASLIEYSASREFLKEIPYWKEIERKTLLTRLPKDKPANAHTQKNKRIAKVELTKKQTQKLLKDVHWAYRTDMNDILLTALGLSIHNWTGQHQVLLNLESHGRHDMIKGLHISRTVGWFTSQYPVLLDMSHTDDVSHQIKVIKEDLRKIPNKGIGYEMLKYLTPPEHLSDLSFSLDPEICFNYLGQLDDEMSSRGFAPSPYSNGASLGADGEGNIGQENEIYFPLIFTGYIQNGQLYFTISYNEHQYSRESMDHLASQYRQQLLNIIEHCEQKKMSERTPSDFSCTHLDMKEIDKVYALLEQSFNKLKIK